MRDKLIGQTISHYRIIEKLGEGGMGILYKAEDIKLKRTVALKFLPHSVTRDQESKKRFIQEAQAASILDHINICNIHEIDETKEGQIFIAMTLYHGQTLNERIEQGPLKLADAVEVAIQIAQGMAKAHKQGIIHRDIKPANIMFTRDKVVKILDFGLAKLKGEPQVTEKGYVMGTVTYMSPEQVMGEDADIRTDIWALGAVFYELITGQPAFKGQLKPAIMYSIVNEEPEPLTNLCPEVPMELERIVNKALEKSRDDRYQHIDDMILALQKLQQDLDSGKLVKRGKIAQLFKPRRLPQALIVVVLLLAVAIVTSRFLFKQKPAIQPPATDSIEAIRKKNSVAIVYFKNNTGDKNLDPLRQSLTDYLISDLAQSKFIEVLSEERLRDILTSMKKLGAQSYTLDDLKEIASRGDKVYVLVGKYNLIGEEFRINVTIQKPVTGDIVASVSAKGKGVNSISPMIDQLTKKVKSHFQLSIDQLDSDIDLEVGKITTDSTEAFKYYIQAGWLTSKGKFNESLTALKKAVVIDPQFASAHIRIAINYNYLRQYDMEKKHLDIASSFIDRVSPRENHLIKAYRYHIDDLCDKQIEAYKKILEFYPDDDDTNIRLAALYRNMEEWELANKQYVKFTNMRKDYQAGYINQASFLMAKGKYEEAMHLLQQNKTQFSDLSPYHIKHAQIHLCQHQYELALIELEKIFPTDNDISRSRKITILRGNVYQARGDLLKAEEQYTQFMKRNNTRSRISGLFWRAYLHLTLGQYKVCKKMASKNALAQKFKNEYQELQFILFIVYVELRTGNFSEALGIARKAVQIGIEAGLASQKKADLFFYGLATLKLGNMQKAETIAEQLKESITKAGYKKALRRYYHLMAKIFLAKGKKANAIESMEKAVSMLSSQCFSYDDHAHYFGSLADALYQNKQYDRAAETYEKITSLTTGRLQWGDIYAKSFFWLGKIYQQKGKEEKAITNYDKFLQLWQNADPNIREIEEARKQLNILKQDSEST